MSNNQIFESSQKLEWNCPNINGNNQALEQSMVEKVEVDSLYEHQQFSSLNNVCQFNGVHHFQNTKQDIESILRHVITKPGKESNDMIVGLKNMCLSHQFDKDERALQIQSIIENIFNHMHLIQYSDDIDDNELAYYSEICENNYYGYVTDAEMIQADRLLNESNKKMPYENMIDSHTLSELVELLSRLLTNQVDQFQHVHSDEYY